MVGRGEYVADMGYLGWAAVWDVAAPARRDAGIRHDGDSLETAQLQISTQCLGYQTRVVNACNCIQMVEETWVVINFTFSLFLKLSVFQKNIFCLLL